MSVFARFGCSPVSTGDKIRGLVNYSVTLGTDRKPVYEPRDPVAPSRAEDFSIRTRAIFGRAVANVYRSSADPVDVQQLLNF